MNYLFGLAIYLLFFNIISCLNTKKLNSNNHVDSIRYKRYDSGENGEDEYEEIHMYPVQNPGTITKNKKTALSASCSSHNPSHQEINESDRKKNMNSISIKNSNVHNSDQNSNSHSSAIRPFGMFGGPVPFGAFGGPGPFINPYPFPGSNGVFRNSIRNRLHLFKRGYEPNHDPNDQYKREITGVLNMLNTLARSSYNKDKLGKPHLRAIKIRRRQ
jgi:hypothetical protein